MQDNAEQQNVQEPEDGGKVNRLRTGDLVLDSINDMYNAVADIQGGDEGAIRDATVAANDFAQEFMHLRLFERFLFLLTFTAAAKYYYETTVAPYDPTDRIVYDPAFESLIKNELPITAEEAFKELDPKIGKKITVASANIIQRGSDILEFLESPQLEFIRNGSITDNINYAESMNLATRAGASLATRLFTQPRPEEDLKLKGDFGYRADQIKQAREKIPEDIIFPLDNKALFHLKAILPQQSQRKAS